MIRGTTPKHIFRVPFDTSLIKECRVVYAQNDTIVFIKYTDDCVFEGDTITTDLTQEDTFAFDDTKPVQIQLRILTVNDTVLASLVERVGVSQCLDNEVIL